MKLRHLEPQSKVQLRCDQYHFLQDRFVGKQRNVWKYADFASCYLQRALGVQRMHGTQVRYGYANWSITRDLAEFYVRHEDEIRRQYQWTYCADECFPYTEILGTQFEHTISSHGDLRYAEWKQFSRHDRSPRVLTEDDYDVLQQPNVLFARKFASPDSDGLVARLVESWGVQGTEQQPIGAEIGSTDES